MRPALALYAAPLRRAERSLVERVIESLGADAAMVESVFGDLEEEGAERAARDGALLAALWQAREAARSAPWLLASALRQRGWRGRAPLAGILALLALVVTMLVLAIPTRLSAAGDAGEGVVINNLRPVQLGTRVLGVGGRALPVWGVRYHWLSGAPIPVSAAGVAQCTYFGDATVRATWGPLATDMLVRCRPVSSLGGDDEVSVVVGERARPIPIVAKDAWNRVVSPLRGEITIDDTSVVATEQSPAGEQLLRARAPGSSEVVVKVGDHSATLFVDAYRRAGTPTGIKPGERVAVAAELSSHDYVRWTLSASRERYLITVIPENEGDPMPYVAVAGAACIPSGTRAFACTAPTDASVYLYYPTWGSQRGLRRGSLAVARAARP